VKRSFDFFVALVGLLILLPFFIIIGISIYKDDRGPIFFKQKRVGKYGKLFLLYKFRSMTVNESAKEGVFEPGNMSRITSVGKFLRKTKLDELPQLYNVLKGEMSLVGPRPEIEKWVSVYPERWEKILSVKPGITDNASIMFRSEESILAKSNDPELTYKEIILPKKIEFYEEYATNHSFINDLKLIFKTFFYIIYKN
jgi:lipopolysaccharide/colanic/teichoic acid biosynthesis glycosyltransferase